MRRLFDFAWLVRKIWLTRASRRYFSQFGEDVLLANLIPANSNSGFYVDVGAYHPRKFSNTYALYRRGWRGINVDMDPLKIEAFKLARPADCNVCAAVSDEVATVTAYAFSRFGLGSTIDPEVMRSTSGAPVVTRTVTTRTLEDILRRSPYAGREIDMLSIDVEGHDFQVLRSFDIRQWKPKIVVVESLLRDLQKILSSPVYAYLTEHGYALVGWAHLSLVFRLADAKVHPASAGPEVQQH